MKSLFVVSAAGLAIVATTLKAEESGFETDFDHKVQYKLTEVSKKQYELEVARLGKVKFSKMNVFTTRKAKQLCGGLGYSITYVEGVEGFDDRKFNPNYIFPSLKVSIKCP